MGENNKYFIYARKSTRSEDRQVRSIQDQFSELRQLAAREQLHVIGEFEESRTAKSPGRPVFNAMLDRIERGEANGVLAWHPDRLARNWLDAGRIIHLIDSGKVAQLRFPNVPFDPTASGKFLLGIMFGQSKHYSDNLAENIRRGQRQRVRAGHWPMMPALGYLIEPKTKRTVLDPLRAPLVRQAFKLCVTGKYTTEELAIRMTRRGLTSRSGKPMSRAQYYRMLRNPIYCGLIKYGGEVAEGKHTPIVSLPLFEKCQQQLGHRSKPKSSRLKPYLYRGVFRCGECGGSITTETHKGHNYLRCTKRLKRDCSQRYVREEEVSRQVAEFVDAFDFPDIIIDDIVEVLGRKHEKDKARSDEVLAELRGEVASVEAHLERLLSAYLAEGISLAEFQTKREQLTTQKMAIRHRISLHQQSDGCSWFEPARRFFLGLKRAAILERTKSNVEKRDFLRKVGSNLFLTDGCLTVEFQDPWKTLVAHGFSVVRGARAIPSRGLTARQFSERAFLRRRRVGARTGWFTDGVSLLFEDTGPSLMGA